jgi:hypothetical protein
MGYRRGDKIFLFVYISFSSLFLQLSLAFWMALEGDGEE